MLSANREWYWLQLTLLLRDNRAAHGLHLDQTILENNGIDTIRDTGCFRVGRPFKKEDVVHEDRFDIPLGVRKCLEGTSKKLANAIFAAHNARWSDDVSRFSIIQHCCIQVFIAQSLGMMLEDL